MIFVLDSSRQFMNNFHDVKFVLGKLFQFRDNNMFAEAFLCVFPIAYTYSTVIFL